MRFSNWMGLAVAASLGLGAAIAPVARAVQLADGTVYFDRPPTLLDSATTRNQAAAWGGTYYFTLGVPADAGEPLQRVAIAQQNGETSFRQVEFDTEDTFAFLGTRGQRGEALTIRDVNWDEETQTVEVVFDPPVPPGRAVTVGLRPERNPRNGGVYLFGVTAYPAGAEVHGQFLGYGRFHFYEGDGVFPLSDRFFHRR